MALEVDVEGQNICDVIPSDFTGVAAIVDDVIGNKTPKKTKSPRGIFLGGV